jgi:hypothetical protein
VDLIGAVRVDLIAAFFEGVPAATAASVRSAAEAWKSARGRYPRFVVIEHLDLASGQGCVLFASTNIFATDTAPADRVGTWILDTDALNASVLTDVGA